ncbi:MAG: glycosyltransferase family 2 protein [bacterium]|nr:glycosyltransferase family 2 protein [bacterium]
MDITLIIPAYNEEDYIGQCLDAAIKNSGGKFKEIIVVDNASTDKTAEVAGRYPRVKVVTETRRGTGHARQTGLEYATGNIVAYIDADTVVPEGWVDRIETEFNDPEVVLLSGPYRYYDAPWYKRWILNSLWWISAPITSRVVGFMALGGNMVMKKTALEAVGFDRSIAFYGDDTDIARRMHTKGKTLWRMSFYIYTSSRRFLEHGIIKTNAIYVANYLWPVIFHRPFTAVYQDIKRV